MSNRESKHVGGAGPIPSSAADPEPEAQGTAGTSRRAALAALGGGVLALPTVAACAQAVPGQKAGATTRLTLRFSDLQGQAMSLAAVRKVQTNSAGEKAYDDALLDAETLELIAVSPLYEDEGSICLDVPKDRACTLNMSWPTKHGYSALMVDLPGAGSVEVCEAAARTLHQRQEAQAAQDPTAAKAVEPARQATQEALEACKTAATPQERGKRAIKALELAAEAQLSLDHALISIRPEDSVLGVTFTRPPTAKEMQDLAQGLGEGGRTAVRIVIDDHNHKANMEEWKTAVRTMQDKGLQIVGQICDSYHIGDYDETSWDARVSTLLAALPSVEAWEVGNELGGSWLGPNALKLTLRAARAVRERTKATTVLTLYYQLGLDTAKTSVFNTARLVKDSELAGLIDVVGLSIYPQWHPLGTAADRVMSTLAKTFPEARVGVTELGYGGDKLEGPWWFGNSGDQAEGRKAVVSHITSAALARPQAWGAPFWWYFLEDETPGAPGGPVRQALQEVDR